MDNTGRFKKNGPLAFSKNLCLNVRFGALKWVLVGKIQFQKIFVLWSNIQKRKENIENGDFKKSCIFYLL